MGLLAIVLWLASGYAGAGGVKFCSPGASLICWDFQATECHPAGDGCNTECCTGDHCSATLNYCPPAINYLPAINPKDLCGNSGCTVTSGPSSEPIDAPAQSVSTLAHAKGSWASCGQDYCTYDEDIYEDRPSCEFDKRRILIGPNGNGEWFCHLPQ